MEVEGAEEKYFLEISHVRAMRPEYIELLGPKPAVVRIAVSHGNTDVIVPWCGLILNPRGKNPCAPSKRMGDV